MREGERRKVGKRGQVTIPKELRDRFGFEEGCEVAIYEEAGKLVIERPVTREELAEGYRERAHRARELAGELEDVPSEATDHLGVAPEW